MNVIEIKSLRGINRAAKVFLEKNTGIKKIAFFGKMGVGKTTFIKYLCKNLGISEKNVVSPTFTIINEYKSKNIIIYHFDFYRIKKIDELYEIGAIEYFNSDNYCFIEWPEIIEHILPEDFIRVQITENSERSRYIETIDKYNTI
jgi:tRNA threonylcarbamoyladenosine biosynthesis protein TsaE